MFLESISLQNFRSYKKSEFNFTKNTTFIVGPNTAGKSNLIESIYLLSTGKSFRAEKDLELIKFGESICRVKCTCHAEFISASQKETRSRNTPRALARLGERRKFGMTNEQVRDDKEESTELEVLLVNQDNIFSKKYLVNGISRRRVDFSANLASVLFHPENLDILIGSPGLRRAFLNNVLDQTDRDYRIGFATYEKALRQRNALLDLARETGKRNEQQFEYWDNIIIKNGQLVTKKREELIEFLNLEKKDIFDFTVVYDKSVISEERLLQYKNAELGSGITLVGPHRDDVEFQISNFKFPISNKEMELRDIKLFGSRGQQRLAILQLKLLELDYIEKKLGNRPVFLLDDIFSELDEKHINHILNMLDKQQTIITTTHREFIPEKLLEKVQVIELTK